MVTQNGDSNDSRKTNTKVNNPTSHNRNKLRLSGNQKKSQRGHVHTENSRKFEMKYSSYKFSSIKWKPQKILLFLNFQSVISYKQQNYGDSSSWNKRNFQNYLRQFAGWNRFPSIEIDMSPGAFKTTSFSLLSVILSRTMPCNVTRWSRLEAKFLPVFGHILWLAAPSYYLSSRTKGWSPHPRDQLPPCSHS